ncbi:MAG TPA: hypothetical protein VGL35_00240 [Rhizomicrobium sp.]|jgi:hypothetical protein
MNPSSRLGTCIAIALALSGPALAHGIVGDRFFPATITIDDPFAADELALPTVTILNHETDYDLDYAKSICPGFALSIGAGYANASPPGEPHATGFEDVSLTPVAELFRSAPHEAIVSAGVIWEIGGTGRKSLADRLSTYTPEILFGKGFGDIPDSLALLRPFAVTGQIGVKIPGESANSKAVEWGGALEYSLLYLENNVRDVGLPNIAARLTPIVEFSLETPTEKSGGPTTGTLNPGLIWSGQTIQLAAEAMIPVNGASGRTVGAIAQLHFYVDDIFPHSLGRPIFGSTR